MRSSLGALLVLGSLGCEAAKPEEAPPPTVETVAPIIGGETDKGDPSVVAVYAQQLGATSGFLCTGSIIAPTIVLTAAHCVSPSETGADARFVVLTATDINKRGGQQLAVREVHANPRWSANNLENGHDEMRPYKHTLNVKPGERLSYLVSADAPGRWAYHCHLLYHMEAGMFRAVIVS